MDLLFRFFTVSLLTMSLALPVWTQQPTTVAPQTPPGDGAPTVRIRSDEVLLDIIARDKKGRPVRDLKPEEIEVYENGVRQQIGSLRLVESMLPSGEGAAETQKNSTATKTYVPLDPSRQINLVTMVFDNLDNNGKKLAREAALDFLNNSMNANVMVSVFVVSNGFHIVQPFTSNIEKLRQAIDSVTGRAEIRFADLSQKITEQLEIVINGADFVPPAPAGAAVVPTRPAEIPQATAGLIAPTGTGSAASPTDKAMAQITLSTLRAIQDAQIEQQARASVSAFLHVAREQRRLTGRKTVLYFANGLIVPTNLTDLMKTTISEANRANVTFYTLDTRGLSVDSANAGGLQAMALAIQGSREALTDGPVGIGRGTVSTGSFKSAEIVENSTRLNKQGTLAELAESTGGFLIADTNDLRSPLRRVTAELSSYYIAAYAPANSEPDGKFREVTIKTTRPDVKVQTRNGYFAVPVMDGKPVMGYEMPMLVAANNASTARDFAHYATLLRFRPGVEETQQILLAEVPLSEITFKQDKTKKLYNVHLAVLGLIRDASGKVVRRVSQDYPLQGKWSRVESLKKGNLDFSQPVTLPPGNYTLQTIVYDFEGSRTSAQTRPIIVPVTKTEISLSSLTVVRRVDDSSLSQAGEDKPLLTPQGRIVPLLTGTVNAEEDKYLSFYLTAYLPAGTKDAPPLNVELQRDGEVLSRGDMTLPAPDAKGRVQHLFGVPIKTLRSGKYLARAIIKRGETQAVTETTFSVDNPKYVESADTIAVTSTPKSEAAQNLSIAAEEPRAAAPVAPPIKTAGFSETVLAASRSVGESKSLRAAAVNIPELLTEVERNGITLHQNLLKYTYQLRKVRHVLDDKGDPTKEEYQDYEAYPVRGQHVLVQTTSNGEKLTSPEIDLERRRAGFWLEKAEKENATAAESSTGTKQATPLPGYVTAAINGSYRGQYAGLLIDPAAFLRHCDFSDPRYETLNGREMIALDFMPRQGVDLPLVKLFVTKLTGIIWIDAIDKVLVRIEARNLLPGVDKNGKPLPISPEPKLIYQQSRQPAGEWFPSVIRLNADGDASAFFGINWDVAFEFSSYKQFNTTGEQTGDVKTKKQPNQ